MPKVRNLIKRKREMKRDRARQWVKEGVRGRRRENGGKEGERRKKV